MADVSEHATARAQAASLQAEADATTLVNVRERCQQAADSWTKIADRIERVGLTFVAKVDDLAGEASPARTRTRRSGSV